MAIRYNPKTDRLILAVGDLLPNHTFSKSSSRSASIAPQRLAAAQDAHLEHADWRSSTINNYKSEEVITWKGKIDGCNVIFNGRMDGFWLDKQNHPVVEEVKSTYSLPSSAAEPHLFQLQLYLWMLQQKHAFPPAGILTYINIFSRSKSSLNVAYQPDIDRFVRERLSLIVRWYRDESARLQERSANAYQIRWPHKEFRENQDSMVCSIEDALHRRRNLLLEAPTGSGKTEALLFAAIRLAAQKGFRLAFATSRVSQQLSRAKLIESITTPETLGRVLVLSAKKRFETDFEDTVTFDPYNPPDWVSNFLAKPTIIDRKQIQDLADSHRTNAFHLQQFLTRYADVLIGDLNLLANPFYAPQDWYRSRSQFRKTVLLVDEAHNLGERLRGKFRIVWQPSNTDHLHQLARSIDDNALIGVLDELENQIEQLGQTDFPEETVPFPRIDTKSSAFPFLFEQIFQSMLLFPNPQEDSKKVFEKADLLRTAFHSSECFEFCFNRSNESLVCELLDPGFFYSKLWKQIHSVVLFSATLTPFELTLAETGLPTKDTDCVQIQSEFGAEQMFVLRHAGLPTTWSQRPHTAPRLATLLSELPKITDGKWLVFFPSGDYLHLIEGQLRALAAPNLALGNSMPKTLVNRIVASMPPQQLHLTLLGGKIAEGVDLETGPYDGVVILTLGLPPTNLQTELLREWYETEEYRGFRMAYLVPALRKIIQASGRLIRNENDRGALVLIDPRYGVPELEDALPDPWRTSEIFVEDQELLDRIAEWW